MSDAGIIDLRFGEKQSPQSGQILDVFQASARDSGSGEIKFLKMLKSSEINQVGISDPPFAEVDADYPVLIVERDPCAKFLEVVDLLGAASIDLGHGGFQERPHLLSRPVLRHAQVGIDRSVGCS